MKEETITMLIATLEKRIILSRPLGMFDRALILADLLEIGKQEALNNILAIRELELTRRTK